VCLQYLQGDGIQRIFVSALQHHGWGHAGFQSFQPSVNTQTPPRTRLEAGKTPFRAWRDQVIASRQAEIQKSLGHSRTNQVLANVVRVRAAAAVAEIAGQGVVGASS